LSNVSQFCIKSLICLARTRAVQEFVCALSTSSCEITLFSLGACLHSAVTCCGCRSKKLSKRKPSVTQYSFGIVHTTIENVFSCALTIDNLNLSLCCQNNDRSLRANIWKGRVWKLIFFMLIYCSVSRDFHNLTNLSIYLFQLALLHCFSLWKQFKQIYFHNTIAIKIYNHVFGDNIAKTKII